MMKMQLWDNQEKNIDFVIYVNLCKIWVNMDENTGHCFDCNVCVEGYDHHCPWTGKCIGKNNLQYFYTFLISILFVFSYFILVLT